MLVVSPRVILAEHTDATSLKRLLAGHRFVDSHGKRKEGEALAIAIWEFMVDCDEGLFHYCPPTEKLSGHYVWDVVKLFNVFGWCVCGIAANTYATIARCAGLPARIVFAKGHLVSEVFYHGAWHMLDADLQAFHRRHFPEQDIIASYEDCINDPTLVSLQKNPSTPFYLPDRPPERMADLYKVKPRWLPAYIDSTHTMDFVLRPGEILDRTALPLGKWIWFEEYSDFKSKYPGEWMENGPGERHRRHRTYCNGRWTYEPDLTDKSLDYEAGVFKSVNIKTSPSGLVPESPSSSSCIFEFNSPWVFSGTPKHDGKDESHDGVIVEFEFTQKKGGIPARLFLADAMEDYSLNIWESPGLGRHKVRIDITEHTFNTYRYLLKFDFLNTAPDSFCLHSLKVVSSIMLSRASLGSLNEGDNRVSIKYNDDDNMPTRRFVKEMDFSKIDRLEKAIFKTENLLFNRTDPDLIKPLDSANCYSLIFRIDAPQNGVLSKIFLHAGYRGKDPANTADERLRASWSENENGPWVDIFNAEVLPHAERWHIEAEGTASIPSSKILFVRVSGKVGLKTIKIRAHYLDSRISIGSAPELRISHEWEENGKNICHHQTAGRPGIDHEYIIRAGASPVFKKVVMSASHLNR